MSTDVMKENGYGIEMSGRMDGNPIRPKTAQTIDSATQVIDLTAEIEISSLEVVSQGGFSDIYRGVWRTVLPSRESPGDTRATQACLVF
jgi:hypothetical protein